MYVSFRHHSFRQFLELVQCQFSLSQESCVGGLGLFRKYRNLKPHRKLGDFRGSEVAWLKLQHIFICTCIDINTDTYTYRFLPCHFFLVFGAGVKPCFPGKNIIWWLLLDWFWPELQWTSPGHFNIDSYMFEAKLWSSGKRLCFSKIGLNLQNFG